MYIHLHIFSSIYWFLSLYGKSKWFPFTSHTASYFSFCFVDRQQQHLFLLYPYMLIRPHSLCSQLCICCCCLNQLCGAALSISFPHCFLFPLMFLLASLVLLQSNKETVNALSQCILDFVVCALELNFISFGTSRQQREYSSCVWVSDRERKREREMCKCVPIDLILTYDWQIC